MERARSGSILRYADDGLPIYRKGQAPAHLGTRKQLQAQGLSTAGLSPSAWLYYNRLYHLTCPLYDRRQARPVRPLTERQRASLAAGRRLAHTRPCTRCGARIPWYPGWKTQCEACCRAAVQALEARREAEQAQMLADAADQARQWAAGVLADPAVRILDTETTGLEGSYAVQIAVLTVTGDVLVDTLLNPQIPIPSRATAIHGITDAMVATAPTFSGIMDLLAEVLHGHRVVIYNAAFDLGVLRRELDRHYRQARPLPEPPKWEIHPAAEQWLARLGSVECAMKQYARWYGQWDYRGFTWQPLNGGHTALDDCRAVLKRLHEMAAETGS